jgi:hypothetical protein
MNAPLRTFARGAVIVGVLFSSGCATIKVAPVNLSEPGWQLQETAAVWTPKRDGPELVGELLLATNPDGRRWVQFSKQTMPVVSAQLAEASWQISSSIGNTHHSGRGTAPKRVVWFQIDRLPPGTPAPPWSLERRSDGSWRLSNSRTGESVDAAAVIP